MIDEIGPVISQEGIAVLILISIVIYDDLKYHYDSYNFLEDPVDEIGKTIWLVGVFMLVIIIVLLSQPVFLNIIIVTASVLYALHSHLFRISNRWLPTVLPVIITYILYPSETTSFFADAYMVVQPYFDLIIENPLPVLAALFAYMSWREIYIPNRSEKESELHDHFYNVDLPKNKKDRIHRSKGSITFGTEEARFRKEPEESIFVSLTIERVIVNEKPGRKNQSLKYIPFGEFRGSTEFTISSHGILPPEDQLWTFLAKVTYVEEIERINDHHFRVTIDSTKVSKLDTVLFILYEQITNVYHIYEDERPVSGRIICGMIKYQRPKSLFTYFLSRKEINNIRELYQSRSSGVIIRNNSINGRERIKHYQHDGWVRGFYFSWKHLVERVHPRIDHSNQEPSQHQSISHGSQYLRQVYADTTIHGERPAERSSFNCTELAVEVNPPAGKKGVCHQIPVSNFRIEELADVEFSDQSFDLLSSDVSKDEILGKELTAKYLSVDQTNIDVTYEGGSSYLIGMRWTISGNVFVTYARGESNDSDPSISPYLPGIRRENLD